MKKSLHVMLLALALFPFPIGAQGFFGGFANGLQQGMQLRMQKQHLETQEQAVKREGEAREAQQAGNREQLDARSRIMKVMLTTDLLDDPEKLSKLAAYAADRGRIKVASHFSDLATKAQQRAYVEMFQSLMIGNVDRAIDMAKRSGTPFADRPVKVSSSNPNDYQWRVIYEGSPEAVIDAKNLFETYSRTAPTRDVASAIQGIETDPERDARMELIEEQKRTLQEQRRRGSTSELRDNLIINELLGPRF